MEPHRASPVRLHHPELARQATAQPSGDRPTHRQHQHQDGPFGCLSDRCRRLRERYQSLRRRDGRTQHPTRQLPRRLELHFRAQAARCLTRLSRLSPLVTEKFGIEKIALVVGWSMGAQQSYQWGALYPDMVARIAPFCGSARTARHNFVFLEGVKAALTADDAWRGGWYDTPPTKGLRAMGRVYAGWGFSQAFYREKIDLQMGFASLEDFLIGFWEGLFLNRDANNLLAMLWTWQHGDISANELYKGDFERALGSIRSRAIVMPGQTDLYFPPEDNVYEVSRM